MKTPHFHIGRREFARRCLALVTLRRGFTAAEALLALVIIAAVAGASIPTYRNYHLRSDLNLAEDQTRQLLHRAQILAQSSQYSSAWGYHVPSGTIFKGVSFFGRDTAYDEVLSLPPSITVSGVQEVAFSKLYGVPNTTGSIVLTALNGEKRAILISNDVLSGSIGSRSTLSSQHSSSLSSKKKKWGDDDDDNDDNDDNDNNDEDLDDD